MYASREGGQLQRNWAVVEAETAAWVSGIGYSGGDAEVGDEVLGDGSAVSAVWCVDILVVRGCGQCSCGRRVRRIDRYLRCRHSVNVSNERDDGKIEFHCRKIVS